jgi:hypothetical protein
LPDIFFYIPIEEFFLEIPYLYVAEIKHSNLSRVIHFSTFADNPAHRKITYRKIIFPENGNRLFSRIVWIFVTLARDEKE